MDSSDHKLTSSFVPAKAFYFCFYGAAASLLPFLALYYENLGLSGRQIGLLVGIPPVVSLVSAPLWTAAADAVRRHKTILTITMSGAILLALVLSKARGIAMLIPTVALYAFFASPVVPLADNAIMEMLAGKKELYGRQRAWGAVGWGLAAPLVGYLIETRGLHWSFWAYAGIMLVGIFVIQKIPFRKIGVQAPFWQGARSLLSNRAWMLFLLLAFVGGMGQAVIHNFLFLYMDNLGASKTVMGLALTVATISELPMFFFADRFLVRWDAQGLFIFGAFVFVLRALAMSYITVPWLVLLPQLLHGLTFSAMWVAGVAYANQMAPSGMGATAQGLFSGVMMGIAAATGAFLGGALYQDLGGAMMYRVMAITVFVSILIYLLIKGAENKYAPNHRPR